MLVSLSSYAKELDKTTEYPAIITIESDTLYLLTESNVDSILFTYALLDEYKRQISISSEIIDKYKEKEGYFLNKIEILETTSSLRDSIISNCENKLTIRESETKELKSQLKKSERKVLFRNIAIGGLTVIIIIISII